MGGHPGRFERAMCELAPALGSKAVASSQGMMSALGREGLARHTAWLDAMCSREGLYWYPEA